MIDLTPEDKKILLGHVITEAGGLYKQLITLGTLFLGGSLFVVEKLRPLQPRWAICIMAISGLLLGLGMILVLLIRWNNIESMRFLAEAEKKKSTSLDKHNRFLTVFSIWLTMLAILLISFTIVLFVAHDKQIPTKECPHKCTTTRPASGTQTLIQYNLPKGTQNGT